MDDPSILTTLASTGGSSLCCLDPAGYDESPKQPELGTLLHGAVLGLQCTGASSKALPGSALWLL